MDAVLLLIQAVLIFAVAFIYANLGLGGGLLFVPILLSTGVTSADVAVPISLTLTMATASASVINHQRKGLVDFWLGRTLVAGALVGAILGTLFTLAFLLNEGVFKAFFTVVLLVFGSYMVIDWVRNKRDVDVDDDSKMTPPRRAGVNAATLGSGFLSGSMGIGGGLLNVPLLVYGLGRKTRKAIGTSSLLIIPTAAVGFAAYLVSHALRGGFALPADFILIPILFPVVFVGAYLGSRWGLQALRSRPIALIFVLLLFVAALKLVYDLLNM